MNSNIITNMEGYNMYDENGNEKEMNGQEPGCMEVDELVSLDGRTVSNGSEAVAASKQQRNEIATTNSMFSEIDLNEFEESCKLETLEMISRAIQNGALRPEGLCPIEIMEDGVTGLYAKRVNSCDGKSNVAIVYFRNDGSCTEDILISNADLYSIIAAVQSWATPEVKKDAKRALKKLEKTLLDYWDGIIFNAADVVQKIAENLSKLPVDNSRIPDVKIVYSTILDFADSWSVGSQESIFLRRGFYAFPPNHFEEIAGKLQMTTKTLAEFLKRNGLLYLQNSSCGYQSNVRGEGNCYCVRVLKQFEHEIIYSDEDIAMMKAFGVKDI